MPEETIEIAPAVTRPTFSQDQTALAARFDETFGKVKTENPDGVSPEKLEKKLGGEELKPTPTTEKPIEPKPPVKGEVPDHLLTGDKPAAQAAEDDILKAEPPKGLSAKASENWKKLQESSAKRIADLEAKIKERDAQPSGADTIDWKSKLEAAEARATELEQRVERTDFEKSPRFQSQFIAKEQNALKDAAGYLEGSEVNPNIIDLAARVTGAARIKLLNEAGVSGELLSAIMPSLRAYDDIQRDKASALEDWKGTAAQWQQEHARQKTAAEAAEHANEERVLADVGKRVAEKFEVYQKVDGHDAWNAQVDNLHAEAKKFFAGEMPLDQIAEVAFYGLGAKHLHGMFHTLQGKYREAQTELAKLKSASPGGGNPNGQNGKGSEDPTDKLPLREGAAARFDRAIGR